jgi:hypothetical protein
MSDWFGMENYCLKRKAGVGENSILRGTLEANREEEKLPIVKTPLKDSQRPPAKPEA